jgi:hypothetical protein
VLLKLKRIYNLNFLKFKPFFTYLAALFKVLTSAYKVLIYPTCNGTRAYKLGKRHIKVRSLG